jgi:hypothetical protein
MRATCNDYKLSILIKLLMGATQTKLSPVSPHNYLTAAEKRMLISRFPHKVLDGKALAGKIKQDLKQHIDKSFPERNSRPMLGHLVVGDLA